MKGKFRFTKEEAIQIEQLIEQKVGADSSKQKSIRTKIRKLGFYASDFGLAGGYTVADFRRATGISVSGNSQNIQAPQTSKIVKKSTTTSSKRDQSDEAYILGLCDHILKENSKRQHRFDFLVGDTGTTLPVDAYFPNLELVIEYHEKQHTEAVSFWDKKPTASGISRGEQRKRYDEKRRLEIPKNGLRYLEINYSLFKHKKNKQLLRDSEADMKVLENLLQDFLKNK
jgi:hypothetical protein